MADFGIAEGLMIQGALRDITKRTEEKKFDKKYNEYLGNIQSNPEYMPEGDYDPKALNQARYAHAHSQLEDQRVQKGVFEHQREVIDAQYDKTMGFIKQAQAANVVQDVDSEFKAYEMAYENTFDGNDMVLGKDGKSYTVTNKMTGKATTTAFKDQAEMQKAMKAMADYLGQPEAYAQNALQARIENGKLNAQADWTPLKDDKGNIAYTAYQLDNDTGQKTKVYQIQGQPVSREQIQKAGFMTAADRKTFAEAEYKKAGVKAAGLPKGKEKQRVKGTMEKDVDLYMRAYKDENLTLKQATDMARQDKANKNIMEALNAFKKEEALELSDPDDLQRWKEERERLQEGFQPTQPPGRKARGLPTDKKVAEEVPTDKLPAPKGLKDGQTAGKGKYVIKNGKWTIAK